MCLSRKGVDRKRSIRKIKYPLCLTLKLTCCLFQGPPPHPRKAPLSRPHNTGPGLPPSTLSATPAAGAKRPANAGDPTSAAKLAAIHGLGLTAEAPPSNPGLNPAAAAWLLRVTDRQAGGLYAPLSKLGRPSKAASLAEHTAHAAEVDPGGPSHLPPPNTLSAGGTWRPYDAGHGQGYYINMGYGSTPVPAYRSRLGALALCLSGTATAWGSLDPDSWVSSLARHVGTPWVGRVWNASHNSGDIEYRNFARVDVVLELTRNYWNNARPKTKDALPEMVMFLEELEALVVVVSHLPGLR